MPDQPQDSTATAVAGLAREVESLRRGETNLPDIRETSRKPWASDREDAVRVPTADETAAAVRRAQRALTEIAARNASDRRHERDEAADRYLSGWRSTQKQEHTHVLEAGD
jgi:hypothetical protein